MHGHDPDAHRSARCTDQVERGLAATCCTQELYRAWEMLESRTRPWPELLAPPPLHRRHAAWAVRHRAGRRADEGRVRGPDAGAAHRPGGGRCDRTRTPGPARSTTDPVRYAIGLGATPPDGARLAEIADRWLRGLPGTTLTRAGNGDVPTLR